MLRHFLSLSILLAGCGAPDLPEDGGRADADAAVSIDDAGLLDAGSVDAGLVDAGLVDAGLDGGSDATTARCERDEDCATPTPLCDGATGVCVACTSDAHCAAGSRCDVVTHACVARDTVLLVAPGRSSVLAASYRAGTWTTTELSAPAAGIDTDFGGGVAVTSVDRGVVVLRGNSDQSLYSASWTGTWGALTRQGSVSSSNVSAPAPIPGGALLARVGLGGSGFELHVGRYDDAAGTWSVLDEATGELAGTLYGGAPAIASDPSGGALIVFDSPGGATYRSVTDAGGAWSAAEDIPNAPAPSGATSRGMAAVRRTGSDQVVAALRSGTASELRVALRSAGVWSPAVTLATDLVAIVPAFALTPLPDGRVALAYQNTDGDARLAFFDGASWSAWVTIPISVAFVSPHPIAIARGIDGAATLEVAYVDRAARNIFHTRLLSEASSEWSTPVIVGTRPPYSAVHLAVGP